MNSGRAGGEVQRACKDVIQQLQIEILRLQIRHNQTSILTSTIKMLVEHEPQINFYHYDAT